MAATPFTDQLPFKDRSPDRIEHLGITPTALNEAPMLTRDDDEAATLVGRTASYRLVFQSMAVPGLPDHIRLGRADIHQVNGPVWTQRTHIAQQPGWRPLYEKWMEHKPVGEGYRLTVCVLPVTLDDDVSRRLIEWRDETLAALGVVVGVFDERLAQMELAEDLILEAGGADDEARVIDIRTGIREFTPSNRVRRSDREALRALSRLDTTGEDPLFAGSRWYLRAAQNGPTPDAVVFLWIALESLAKPAWGTKLSKGDKKLSDVEWVERAVLRAGANPADVVPSVGRLAGLRAEIVHGGVEAPALLRDGFYTLEALTRLLLRDRLALGDAGWTLRPNMPNRRGPLGAIGRIGHSFRRITWRAPKTGGASTRQRG